MADVLSDAGRAYAQLHAEESIVCRVALSEPQWDDWPAPFRDAAVRICNAYGRGETPGQLVIELPVRDDA